MTHKEKKLRQLKSLGVLLDSKIQGPLGIRFGLDALLGLIPVIGDFSTSLASLYIIAASAQLGCSLPILLRMILNVALENFVGVIPFLGNIFDFYWKANNKNVALLEEFLKYPQQVSRKSGIIIGLVCLLMLIVLLGTVFLTATIMAILLAWMTPR